ncbi:MAG: DNA double-strand break repair nuclease NurA [Candidatus Aenigmatarchaeota archaeon]
MEKILSELEEIADKIESLEDKREKLGRFLNDIKATDLKERNIPENHLSLPVKPSDLKNRKIGAVDGGLVKKEYHAVDLVLTKAAAAIFEYHGELENVYYLPDPIPTPKLSVFTRPYSQRDFSLAANLERMDIEAELMLKTRRQDLDLLMLDGSIVPHPSSRPDKDSLAHEKYKEVVRKYEKLLTSSAAHVVGVSEDSRSTRLSEILSDKILSKVSSPRSDELEKILETTRDTNLLFHVLKQGERSFCFPYNKDSKKSNVKKELIENVYSFYLKTTEYDRPIRVDFYAEEKPIKKADEIASLLLPVSSQNEEYGIPVMLIEADSRAKLREEELGFIYSTLQDKVGSVPSLYKLRRNKRPF